jgi:predicted ABC-type ATPase
MPEQPQFYIIAGPNGAGKSTFGDLYTAPNTTIFNGDLVFADLCKRYPHIEPERLGGGVAVQLEKDRDAALAAKANFGFESNYSNQIAIDISLFLKEAGY